MAIRVGNKVIRKVYLGTKEIGMGYVGNTDVYPGVVVPSPIYGYTIYTDFTTNLASLRSINLITGETAQIGSADNFGIDANRRVIVNSIEWINGTLYGIGRISGDSRRNLFRLNHLDGTITSTINLSSTITSNTDIVYANNISYVFNHEFDGTSTRDILYAINLSNGQITRVANVPFGNDIRATSRNGLICFTDEVDIFANINPIRCFDAPPIPARGAAIPTITPIRVGNVERFGAGLNVTDIRGLLYVNRRFYMMVTSGTFGAGQLLSIDRNTGIATGIPNSVRDPRLRIITDFRNLNGLCIAPPLNV